MEILTVLKNDKEKYGGQSFSKKEKLEFRDFIADNSLYTLPYQGTPYTWFCKKGGECLCEKLDKVLTNSVCLWEFSYPFQVPKNVDKSSTILGIN